MSDAGATKKPRKTKVTVAKKSTPRKKAAAKPKPVVLEDFDLNQLYIAFGYSQVLFARHLRSVLTDPESVSRIRFCAICNTPGLVESGTALMRGEWVCASDVLNCYPCFHCGQLAAVTTHMHNNSRVCDPCRDEHWFFCEECDDWAQNENMGQHGHGGDGEDSDCGCQVYATTFSIKNGDGILDNDTPTKITLPGGLISDEGTGAISDYLRLMACSYNEDGEPYLDTSSRIWNDLAELGSRWQTRDGNYTKRLSRLAYKKHKMKIPPTVLSRVGDIARDHSKPIDFEVAVTRELNMSPTDFWHRDSCWWQSYSSSRCALKSNGGFAIRTFSDDRYQPVSGRSWVMPLKFDRTGRPQFKPTFETFEPDAFVVFNGYGALEGYAAARILAHMVGLTYRRISFSCSPMYVNSGGYLVSSEEIAHPYTDSGLGLAVEHHSNLFETERKVLANV